MSSAAKGKNPEAAKQEEIYALTVEVGQMRREATLQRKRVSDVSKE